MKIFKIKYDYRLHTVKSGETLRQIALRYGTTEEHIKRLNRLDGAIDAGDMLYIGDLGKRLYTVQPLDTLESIAERYSTNVTALRSLNGINSVYIGQRILI